MQFVFFSPFFSLGLSPKWPLRSSAKPGIPLQALRSHITGEVFISLTVKEGKILSCTSLSGPKILGDRSARSIQAAWIFPTTVSGVFYKKVTFTMR
jgi:hypothetical protein